MFIPRKEVGSALVRSLLPMAFWVCVILVTLQFLPTTAWRLKYYGVVVSLGFIGIWRYSWWLTNCVRSFYYLLFAFPKMKMEADNLLTKYPQRLFIVVASYRESHSINRMCFPSIVEACRRLPSKITLLVSVGGQDEADAIKGILEECEGCDKLNVIFTFQEYGKRLALGYALRAVAREFNKVQDWHGDTYNDVTILMDGDTALAADALEKALPYFRSRRNIGALTTNEIPVVSKYSGEAVRLWYDLKLSKRNQLMASHALSDKVLTLTGRFSLFRSTIAADEEFIQFLDRDHLSHWAYGKIRFLMGDDKSTMFCLMQHGWDMMYVPDSYVFCLEDRKGGFFKIANVLMMRWYGNMLRNNGRALDLGFHKLPIFIWLAFFDQRVSMWTSLIGPVSAIILALTCSGYYLVFYLVWVLITRLIQLSSLVLQGHKLRFADLPMVLFEQWYGSAVKIHCLFNLHKQVWQKERSHAQTINSVDMSMFGVRQYLPKFLIATYSIIFILAILLVTKVLKLPGVF